MGLSNRAMHTQQQRPRRSRSQEASGAPAAAALTGRYEPSNGDSFKQAVSQGQRGQQVMRQAYSWQGRAPPNAQVYTTPATGVGCIAGLTGLVTLVACLFGVCVCVSLRAMLRTCLPHR